MFLLDLQDWIWALNEADFDFVGPGERGRGGRGDGEQPRVVGRHGASLHVHWNNMTKLMTSLQEIILPFIVYPFIK